MTDLSNSKKSDSDALILPLLPLRDIVVFPHMIAPLFVGRAKSVSALANAMNKDKRIFLVTQKKATVDDPDASDISATGVIAHVLQLLRLPDGTVKALVEGKHRARITQFTEEKEFFAAHVSPIIDAPGSLEECEAHGRSILQSFDEYSKLKKDISPDLGKKIKSVTNVSQLADMLPPHFDFKIEEKQRLLETTPLSERLLLLLTLMKREIDIQKVNQKITSRVQDQMQKTQRNYILNEKIRAIKKEMGQKDESEDELKELEKKIKRKRMSKEAGGKVRQEFKKLKMMTPMSAEATVVRNYIDWLLGLPWFKRSNVNKDIDRAEQILNEDHYGLEKPKERILEYLAVQSLVKKAQGPILCLVGPPGVGKTSLAKSVARATGRKFARLSLGGVRDEAEIRGHRRTYIGAMPGKIIQSIKKVGFNNPVFCLDEVDKMSMDFRGDPSAALLEALDPEQNYAFNDHYLDVDYDLTDIMFITTANTLSNIPPPLRDRMEVIHLPGYTEHEKFNIAKEFLVGKQLIANGIDGLDIHFTRDAIYSIIRDYTREAGVRNLEREISSICRKIARDVVAKKSLGKDSVTVKKVLSYLGPPRFSRSQIEEEDQVGTATGLAWTQVGGELLFIETLIMPGKGKLSVTGKLGEVMQESAQAAVSYTRSRAQSFMISSSFYSENDIHIHVPEGAIPKDGPSAGITMCASIMSAISKRPIRRDVAMTGEITLRGRVLPVGGLKEKILAAHRGGIKKILIPKENEKDMREIPTAILKQLEIAPVAHMDEVLSHVLVLSEGDIISPDNSISFNMIEPADPGKTDQPSALN